MNSTSAILPTSFAALVAFQAPVYERLEGLRKTAEDLEKNSGVEKVIPVLIVIAITVVSAAIVYLIAGRLRKIVEEQRLIHKTRLDDGEVAWLRDLATDAGVKPWTRVLRSTSAFEQLTSGYLTKTLSITDDWPTEVLRLRNIAHRAGFTKVATPSGVTNTIEIGSPWPVELQGSSAETPLHGIVCAGTRDEFTVRTVDPFGALGDLMADDSVEIRVHDVEGFEAPSFECRVVQARSKGTHRMLRLEHAGAPGGDGEGEAETNDESDDEPAT